MMRRPQPGENLGNEYPRQRELWIAGGGGWGGGSAACLRNRQKVSGVE